MSVTRYEPFRMPRGWANARMVLPDDSRHGHAIKREVARQNGMPRYWPTEEAAEKASERLNNRGTQS